MKTRKLTANYLAYGAAIFGAGTTALTAAMAALLLHDLLRTDPD